MQLLAIVVAHGSAGEVKTHPPSQGKISRIFASRSARPHRPPWSVEETDACFIVRDANRQALAYVYFEGEQSRRGAAHLLTRDEARRIASNFAKLPEPSRGPPPISEA